MRFIIKFNEDGKTEKVKVPARTARVCVFGKDSGLEYNTNRPCMGNRIECQHPENKGHISCQSLCRPSKCKFHTTENTDEV